MTRAEVRARLASPGMWGQEGSASKHLRYSKPIQGPRGRRRCPWCPDRRSTHVGMANGVALVTGCRWHVASWVRYGAPTGQQVAPPAPEGPPPLGD